MTENQPAAYMRLTLPAAPEDVSAFLSRLNPGLDGLVAAVAQDYASGEVLMLAWMNREAIEQTLDTGDATYYSRSRKRLWVKGETSGNYQRMRSMSLDCDGDAVLLKVDPAGPACHTGARSCFSAPPGTDASA